MNVFKNVLILTVLFSFSFSVYAGGDGKQPQYQLSPEQERAWLNRQAMEICLGQGNTRSDCETPHDQRKAAPKIFNGTLNTWDPLVDCRRYGGQIYDFGQLANGDSDLRCNK